MIEVDLKRYYSPFGTWGKLTLPNLGLCTIERPWLDNKINSSCIPEGRYLCSRYLSKAHGSTFEVESVCGRTYILFHKGNKVSDVKGCIAVGKSWNIVGHKPYIHDSKTGFDQFMACLESEDKFILKISGVVAL